MESLSFDERVSPLRSRYSLLGRLREGAELPGTPQVGVAIVGCAAKVGVAGWGGEVPG